MSGNTAGIDFYDKTDSRLSLALKGAFDFVFALLAITLFSPLLIVIAVAIRLTSPGPVFFCQKRTGYRGAEFTMFKFRTMRVNDQADTVAARPGDSRVTSVGRLLRHTSFDEFPQFFNVLCGDMSVVGPRPHMLSQTEQYRRMLSRYMTRHAVKPGITGWAQINGCRGLADTPQRMQQRFNLDIWYIRNRTFLLDLRIIARTALSILRGDPKAY
ncbi:MAG: exopolysaccharide biosynthesis polyprenyl glycosylphosphotransferase [Paramuribaculum sp.]|jgi:putative colanic acid biosynthesis UDP-glucose lipid carrier transferase